MCKMFQCATQYIENKGIKMKEYQSYSKNVRQEQIKVEPCPLLCYKVTVLHISTDLYRAIFTDTDEYSLL